MEEHSEPMWPVPRVQQQHPASQGPAADRFSGNFAQPDLARHQGHPANYTYDGSSSALRNPIVYSQPTHVPWGMNSQATDYTEYPTASFMAPLGQRAAPSLHNQSPYLGTSNSTYGDSSLHNGGDAFPKVMNGSSAPMGGPYDHTAETLWPLGPNSLDAFAGIPAPSGQVARLTLTSAADKGKLKARSSLPPPKQFKCSACDAIFSRNHDLKRHARIHLAVKPFPCGYCDKAFSRKDALKRHVLVKGCGIGNKKSSDNRKRAATLSKLEHSDGGSTSRAPYDGGSSEPRVRDFSSFRDDLHYQGQQQHQGFQSDAGNSRGFTDRTWSSEDASNPSANLGGEYGARLGGSDDRSQAPQLQQGGLQSYGSQQQPQQYPAFMGEEAFQQSQRQQLPGGLVNAFTSPGGTAASSPVDAKPVMAGSMVGANEPMDSKDGIKQLSRPGSAKMFNNVAYGGAQSFPVAGGVDASGLNAAGLGNEAGHGFGGNDGQIKDRFGAYQNQQPMMSPSQAGPDQMRRQQQFGYFGNNDPN